MQFYISNDLDLDLGPISPISELELAFIDAIKQQNNADEIIKIAACRVQTNTLTKKQTNATTNILAKIEDFASNKQND